MKPTLDRSDQVVAHVVAWHNRHPLAQRITPAQVHSVGVVSLPFAVRGAQLEAPVPATEVQTPADVRAAAPVDLPPAAPDAADDATEVAIEAVVELETEPLPDAAPDTPDTPPPPTPSILDRALDSAQGPPAAAEAQPVAADLPPELGSVPAPAVEPAPVEPALPVRAARPPTRPRAWHPLSWWMALRGRSPFHALFSEDFMPPMRPQRVARWVARHGVGVRPLPSSAPQRLILLDVTRRRVGDDAPEVELHVITAAIGLQDDRHRLLLAPDGRVIGQRHWSRPRITAAASVSLVLMVGVAVSGLWHRDTAGAGALEPALAAASAAPAAASAAAAATPAVAAAAVVVAASAALPALAAVAAVPASAAGSAPDAPPAAASAVALAMVSAEPAPAEPAHAPTSPAASAPDRTTEHAQAPPPPPSVRPRRGRIELPTLVPRLADADRQDLRTSGRALRNEPAMAPDAKAWALVTPPLTDKRQSERVTAQLHAVALLQPVPMRAELMAAGNGWRAVFWPFSNEKDALKVRMALADKGLRTEVVEF